MAKRETEPIDPNDGQRVVELRKYMGMTQLQLAKALGLSVGAIQHMENGRARITSQRFRQLAKVLRVETADLAKPPGSPLPRFLCEEPHDSTEEKNRRPPILGIDDLSNLGFYAWDPLTDQVTRDPSLKSLIGLPTDAPPDLIQWRNIVHPEYLPRVDAILAKSREPGSDGSFYVEYPVVGRDGAERWVAECGRMIFDARRRFVYCIGAVFPLQQWTVKRVASRVLLAFACLWCGIETASDFLQAPIADNVIIMLSESRR